MRATIQAEAKSTQTAWGNALQRWRVYAAEVRKRAEVITNRQHDRGWALALSVGIGHCGCSLHNASIDDNMNGWCKDNPERLRVAKVASRLVDDWRASRVADRMLRVKWDELLGPLGASRYGGVPKGNGGGQ